MTQKKNWIKLISILLLSIIGSFLLFHFCVIDIEKIQKLENDFQFNVISTSAIIGGFLFTGISILISTIDNERIKRLWENNYLDNLYRAAFVGMTSNLVTIVIALVYLCFCINECVEIILIKLGSFALSGNNFLNFSSRFILSLSV